MLKKEGWRGELKIHQASQCRYFEDFLEFSKERSMPEIMKTPVMDMVYEPIEDCLKKYEEREQFDQANERMGCSPKTRIMEKIQLKK